MSVLMECWVLHPIRASTRYRCTSQVCQPYPFPQKSAGHQVSGEGSENKPRVLLAVLLSPQRAGQRHAKGWCTRNGLL